MALPMVGVSISKFQTASETEYIVLIWTVTPPGE